MKKKQVKTECTDLENIYKYILLNIHRTVVSRVFECSYPCISPSKPPRPPVFVKEHSPNGTVPPSSGRVKGSWLGQSLTPLVEASLAEEAEPCQVLLIPPLGSPPPRASICNRWTAKFKVGSGGGGEGWPALPSLQKILRLVCPGAPQIDFHAHTCFKKKNRKALGSFLDIVQNKSL